MLSTKENVLTVFLKKLLASNSIPEETRRFLKPVGTFRPTLSAINAPTYKQSKFRGSILKSLTSNKYTVKDSFAFAEENVEQDSEFFMGSLDVDPLFTNILLEETINICANALFDSTEKVECLSKIKFKELLSLATNEMESL